MHDATQDPPNLEERFSAPEGWRWGTLKHKGREIRYGVSFPKDVTPDAVVVCLPGLSEFGEKYFELARDLNARKMAVWVIEWAGHGESTRYLNKNPQKRHSLGFQNDIDDLHALYLDYIKHSSVHPDVGRIPRAMMAHSMGGNIGLHYLQQHPDTFDCAFFTAPMFGMKVFAALPNFISKSILGIMTLFYDTEYAPGQFDWHENARPTSEENIFSSDKKRSALHNAWCTSKPALQAGGVTWRWLYEAVISCSKLQQKRLLKTIQTHCIIALAGHEDLVDNKVTRKIAKTMPHAQIIDCPDARHELLMESDELRAPLLDAFQKLVKERIIDNPEALKTF